MKSLSKKLLASLLCVGLLSGCNLTPENPGGGGEGGGEGGGGEGGGGGETDVTKELKTGSVISLDSTGYTLKSGETDGEVIHVVEKDGKTNIYGIKAGVAHLTKDSMTVTVNVSYEVFDIALGTDYLNFDANAAKYRGEKDKYRAGMNNEFFMDVKLDVYTWSKEGDVWDLEEKDSMSIDLKDIGECDSSSKPTVSCADDYITPSEKGFGVSFKETAENKEVTLKCKLGTKEVSQTIFVEKGMNVYNDKDMKKYFNDVSYVGNIFVLRTIEATLEENQYKTVHYQDKDWKVPYNTNQWGVGSKSLCGSPYFRFTDNADQGKVTVIGNYCEIDGSKLPNHVGFPKGTPGIDDSADVPLTEYEGYPIMRNFQGVFYNWADNADDVTVEFKNIHIVGNSNRSEADNPAKGNEGFAGIFSQHAKTNITNTIIDHTVSAVWVANGHAEVTVTDSIISDSWCIGIDCYETDMITVRNSQIKDNGAAGIRAQATEKYTPGFGIDIDAASDINNYVSPTAPWFVANGITGLDTTLVPTINGAIAAAGASITDAQNRMNFPIMLVPNGDRGVEACLFNNTKIGDLESHNSTTRFDTGTSFPGLAQIYAMNGNTIFDGFGQDETVLDSYVQAQGADGFAYGLGQYILPRLETGGLLELTCNISTGIGDFPVIAVLGFHKA